MYSILIAVSAFLVAKLPDGSIYKLPMEGLIEAIAIHEAVRGDLNIYDTTKQAKRMNNATLCKAADRLDYEEVREHLLEVKSAPGKKAKMKFAWKHASKCILTEKEFDAARAHY